MRRWVYRSWGSCVFLLMFAAMIETSSTAHAQTPEWIWPTKNIRGNERVFFRKEIELPSEVKKAVVATAADNIVTLFINGKHVLENGAWQSPAHEDVTKQLQKGRNVIALRGINDASNMAGVILRLDVELADGKKTTLVTDAAWKASEDEVEGWQASDLIIVAARPGMGKTALTLSMARNIAVGQGIPVAFFSLEMASVQLITRLISSETGLSSEKLRTGKLEKHEWEQLNVKVKGLEKAPLFIDDTPSLSIFDLRAKARRLASQHGIKMIIIDYLQLMTAGGSQKGGNREQEISMISRNLKALAKELMVPVIALSQLSRAVETRGGSKRPLLSDLRESGAIEQDADIVSFIYRPEYYKIEEWDDEERSPTDGQAEFIIAKHRNGGLENIRLKFLGHLGKFDNLDDFNTPYQFESAMNQNAAANDDTFTPDTFPTPDQAFGSSMNDGGFDRSGDDEVPF